MALKDYNFRVPAPSAYGETLYRLNGEIKTIRYQEDQWEKNITTVYHLNQRKKVIMKERIWATGGKVITRIFFNKNNEFVKEELEWNDGSKDLVQEYFYTPDKLPYLIKRYDSGVHHESIRITYNDLKQVSKEEVVDENNELESILNYEYDLNGNHIKTTAKYTRSNRIGVSIFGYDKSNRQIFYNMYGEKIYKKEYDEKGFLIKESAEDTSAEGTVDWFRVLDYNQRGDVKHVKQVNLKEKTERIVEYQYTYDDMDNIIKCICFLNGKKLSTQKYDIYYYK